MDSKKRSQLALRFFTYGVMTVATIALTVVAIFYAMGYRFNQNQLSFEQGGLVQFRSTPDGASVVLDGKTQRFKTPDRASVPAGQHTVEMRLTGYHTWRKAVNVGAGQLLWLNYARFVPLNVQTSGVRSFAELNSIHPSPDRKWLLLQEKAAAPNFILAATEDGTPEFTEVRLPDSALTRPNGAMGSLVVLEWDSSSRYILVRHDFAGGVEFLRLDRTRPEETVNLTQKFGLNIAEAHFAGNNPNIYARTEDILRRLDIGASAASATLVSGVRSFNVSLDNGLMFVAERPDAQAQPQIMAGLFLNDKEFIVRTFPVGTKVLTDRATYFNHFYIAVSAGPAVYVMRDPSGGSQESAEFANFSLEQPLEKLEFSQIGRMLLAASADGRLATYDLELAKTDQSVVASGLPSWLDDYYLWNDANETLRIFEFDGQNGHDVASIAPGFNAVLASGGKFLYSIGRQPDGAGLRLQVSELVIES